MAAMESKPEAVVTEEPISGGAKSRKVAAPEFTREIVAERAYYISQSGEGGTDDENWHRAEAELRAGFLAL